MKALLLVILALTLGACSNSPSSDSSDVGTPAEPSHSSVESVGANSTEVATSSGAGEASNSSVDTIGANEATSDTTRPVIDPEVDAMFGQLIRQSISNGNEQQALKLVEDAEEAGSLTARDVYLQALEQ
ncbi:hypothetical protein SNR37_003539 [Agarivorans aestuarii]|uniref:Lipoprotein n=1 Tax=Agarivorans aestuarii TaxID=1563703 RepID=A0ABU7G3X7_9ALTE|nr:hypothetical protein [Agarivorans aestuarii]MEE1674107.1 hypothetical protein [Agarivorans aestuarii]